MALFGPKHHWRHPEGARFSNSQESWLDLISQELEGPIREDEETGAKRKVKS